MHKPIKGYSGVKWRVDFLAGSNLVVEASVQRRLETKIDSTFLKFVDITREHDGLKATLVFEDLYVGNRHSLGKKFFPTSEYRTMVSHGFPILTPNELPRLLEFQRGEISAIEISSKPRDFNARSMHWNRQEVGKEILRVLADGPHTRGEIARAITRSPSAVDYVIKTLPQVKKLSSYYGLTEESILRKFIGGRRASSTQRKLAADWLETRFLQVLKEHGRCKTTDFTAKLGIGRGSLTYVVNRLSRGGVIRRLSDGAWSMASPTEQTSLSDLSNGLTCQ